MHAICLIHFGVLIFYSVLKLHKFMCQKLHTCHGLCAEIAQLATVHKCINVV